MGPGTRRTSPSPGENNRPELIAPLVQPLIGKETEERATRASIATHLRYPNGLPLKGTYNRDALDEAYARCGIITEDYAKTFYLVRFYLSLLLLSFFWTCLHSSPFLSQHLSSKLIGRLKSQCATCFHVGRGYECLQVSPRSYQVLSVCVDAGNQVDDPTESQSHLGHLCLVPENR